MDNEADRTERSLRRLPVPYAIALRMRFAGMTDAEVADRLSIDCAAVGPLLTIAKAKFEALTSNHQAHLG